jgi:hypothetical protein
MSALAGVVDSAHHNPGASGVSTSPAKALNHTPSKTLEMVMALQRRLRSGLSSFAILTIGR